MTTTSSDLTPLTPVGQRPVDITIMVDTETLDIKPTAVVTQLAFIVAPTRDLTEVLAFDSWYLPLQPQLDSGRTIGGDTLIWWMDQSDEARAKFKENRGGDSDVLVAFVRSFIRKVDMAIQEAHSTGGKVDIVAKGPQFDIVIIESLISLCGEEAPWKYNWISDLRTLMNRAEVHTDDVKHDDIVKHVALEDCRLQLRLLEAAERKLGLRDSDV